MSNQLHSFNQHFHITFSKPSQSNPKLPHTRTYPLLEPALRKNPGNDPGKFISGLKSRYSHVQRVCAAKRSLVRTSVRCGSNVCGLANRAIPRSELQNNTDQFPPSMRACASLILPLPLDFRTSEESPLPRRRYNMWVRVVARYAEGKIFGFKR